MNAAHALAGGVRLWSLQADKAGDQVNAAKATLTSQLPCAKADFSGDLTVALWWPPAALSTRYQSQGLGDWRGAGKRHMTLSVLRRRTELPSLHLYLKVKVTL